RVILPAPDRLPGIRRYTVPVLPTEYSIRAFPSERILKSVRMIQCTPYMAAQPVAKAIASGNQSGRRLAERAAKPDKPKNAIAATTVRKLMTPNSQFGPR